jgi:hypothetical protein
MTAQEQHYFSVIVRVLLDEPTMEELAEDGTLLPPSIRRSTVVGASAKT